jgi:hypothetical protein
MSSRRDPWLLGVIGVVVGVGVIGVVVSVIGVVVVSVVGIVGGDVGIVGVGVLGGVVVGVVFRARAQVRTQSHRVRVRRTRSSGLPGGVGWLRVSRGGTLRHLLHACTSMDRLVDYLLDRAVDTLPVAASARFAEEWQDHRQHYSGWRLVWWALCVRVTARRTVTALGLTRLPRDE